MANQQKHISYELDDIEATTIKFKLKDSSTKMSNPRQPVFTLDHNVQDTSETNLNKYAGIEEFAALEILDVSSNQVQSLTFSQNLALFGIDDIPP